MKRHTRKKPRKLIVVLPLPVAGLSPNARKHWRLKAKLTATARRLAKMTAMVAWVEQELVVKQFRKAQATERFYWPDKRRRDVRNAEGSLKSYWDGIIDAGVLPDDDYEHLTHLPSEFHHGDPEPPHLRSV